MIVPATLSREILHNLLRVELNYQGLIITDALYNMSGIANHFDMTDATIKTFQAGADIALMPVYARTPDDVSKVSDLIEGVVSAVESGELSKEALDASVKRIVLSKINQGIENNNGATSLADIQENARSVIGNAEHKSIEKQLTEQSITLIKNDYFLPATTGDLGKIHILTPWGEQGNALGMRFKELGVQDVTNVKFSATDWETEKVAIAEADTIIVGTLSTAPSPVEEGIPTTFREKPFLPYYQPPSWQTGTGSLVFNVAEDKKNTQTPLNLSGITDAQFARYALEEAKALGKKTILISLRAPYDVVHYDDVADAVLASYSYYGYDYGYLRGPSMPTVVDTIMGLINPQGKLPVTVKEQHEDGSLGEVAYPLHFGLSYPD